MSMILDVKTRPSNPPVSLDDVKGNTRVGYLWDDKVMKMKLYSAWSKLEQMCQKTFCTTTYTLTLDAFPIYSASMYYGSPLTAIQLWFINRSVWPLFNQTIFIPKPPVQSINSIKYVAWDTGILTTLDPSQYMFIGDQPARLTPAYGLAWPVARFQPGSIQIEYVAGYGDPGPTPDPATSPIPAHIQEALCQLTTFLYLHRGDEQTDIPDYIEKLLYPERIGNYM